MTQKSIGYFRCRPDHPLPHAGQVDRYILPRRGQRPLPALNVDIVVVAGEADRLTGMRALRDQPDQLHALADVGCRLAVRNAVPAFVEPF